MTEAAARAAGVLLAATNEHGHMRQINEALAGVFDDHAEGPYEVFGIDTAEARLREQLGASTSPMRSTDGSRMADSGCGPERASSCAVHPVGATGRRRGRPSGTGAAASTTRRTSCVASGQGTQAVRRCLPTESRSDGSLIRQPM